MGLKVEGFSGWARSNPMSPLIAGSDGRRRSQTDSKYEEI